MTRAALPRLLVPAAGAKGNSTEAQRARVLARLRSGPATTAQLRRHQDVMMPAARIIELRRAGHNIITDWVTAYTDAGVPHRMGRYSLVSEPTS